MQFSKVFIDLGHISTYFRTENRILVRVQSFINTQKLQQSTNAWNEEVCNCLQSHLMRQPRAWSVSSNSDESKNLRGARSLSFFSLLQHALRANSNPSTVTRLRWTKSTSWTRLRLLINMHRAVSETEQLHKFICQNQTKNQICFQ